MITKITTSLTQPTFLPLTFRSLWETFIRKSMINSSSSSCQLITWLSWDAWSVSADLFCSDTLDACWFLVKGLHWLTMHLMITTWSTGQLPLFWTKNWTKVLDESNRQYIFKRRDDNPWTWTRVATCWATRTTDFLQCRITIVARTGWRIDHTSSDEGLWQRLKHQR